MTRELVTVKEVAATLGVSQSLLRDWRDEGIGPPWFRLERMIRYDKRELMEWLEAKKQQTS